MATRACIKIQGIKFAKVYKHWDGYPEGMLDWLETFNKNFAEQRGDDPQYKFAQLLRSSTKPEFDLDKSEFTGYGVVPYKDNCFEEWEYTLLKNGEVEVREAKGEGFVLWKKPVQNENEPVQNENEIS